MTLLILLEYLINVLIFMHPEYLITAIHQKDLMIVVDPGSL